MKIEKRIGKYVIFDLVLGEGAQGICKKACLEKDCSQIFAVKIISKELLKLENEEDKNDKNKVFFVI